MSFVVVVKWWKDLLFTLEERIPCRQERGLLLKEVEGALRNEALFDYEAEHIFVKPLVGHDEVTAYAAVQSPRVFDLPFAGLSFVVEVNGTKCHRMAGSRSKSRDAFSLRHREVSVEERTVVVVVEAQYTRLFVVELAHVARHVHTHTVLDAGNGHLLDFFDRQVEVGPVVAVVSVAVEVDGIGLVVRTRGVVHEQHVVVFQIPTYKALVERERSVLLSSGARRPT